jgi:hypothetical protein
MPSCAAWLSWKFQIAPGTAREHVRVARALTDLPYTRAEFAAARLSYAKVRALTRIATPENEQDLAEMATPMTAGQLDRFARAHRQVTRGEQDGRPACREPELTWRTDGSGISIGIQLPCRCARSPAIPRRPGCRPVSRSCTATWPIWRR